MTYATRQDLIDRFGEGELIQLTDRDGGGVIDDTVLNDALADADDEVNARLAARFTLPLASTPRVLVRVAADVARYYLYDDRATDQVRRRYDDAIKLLTGIAQGTVNIGLDDDNAPVEDAAGTVEFQGDTPVFGRTSTSGF